MHYTSHSFRIDATTTAAACSLPSSSIKLLIRWSSTGCESYIRQDSHLILDAQLIGSQLIDASIKVTYFIHVCVGGGNRTAMNAIIPELPKLQTMKLQKTMNSVGTELWQALLTFRHSHYECNGYRSFASSGHFSHSCNEYNRPKLLQNSVTFAQP